MASGRAGLLTVEPLPRARLPARSRAVHAAGRGCSGRTCERHPRAGEPLAAARSSPRCSRRATGRSACCRSARPAWADRARGGVPGGDLRSAHLAKPALCPAHGSRTLQPRPDRRSWEGGSNLILVRPPWQIIEAASVLLNPFRERRLRERRRMALARLVDRARAVRRERSPADRPARQAERELDRGRRDRASTGPRGEPLLLGGDFNVRPGSTTVFEDLERRFGLCAADGTRMRSTTCSYAARDRATPPSAVAARSGASCELLTGLRGPAPAAVRPRSGRGTLRSCDKFLALDGANQPLQHAAVAKPAEPPVRDARPARARREQTAGRAGGGGARPARARRAEPAQRGAAHPQATRGGPRRRRPPRAHDPLGRAGDGPELVLARRACDGRLPRRLERMLGKGGADAERRERRASVATADRRLRRPVRAAGAGAARRPHAR